MTKDNTGASRGHSNNTTRRVKRRSVLHSIGGVASAITFTGTGVSENLQSADQLLGITYDTLTHLPQRRAVGQIAEKDGGITGKLNIGGFNVKFGQDSPLKPSSASPYPEYYIKKTQEKFRREDLPLVVRFNVMGDHISGKATRPHKEYGKLGFTMGPVGSRSEDDVVNGLKRGLMENGEGVKPKGLDSVPPVPDSGVPKNTAFPAVLRGRPAPAKKHKKEGDSK